MNRTAKTPPIYERAITTHRSPRVLARVHGFGRRRGGIAGLAARLPEGAKILDVGAGASSFGNSVAALRPDITWINFDYSYRDPAILQEAADGSPGNVVHVSGDATELDRHYDPASFDAVFSYWLLPHLSLEEPEPAARAARHIFRLAKQGAYISVGPDVGASRLVTFRARKARSLVKDDSFSEEDFVKSTLAHTHLRGRALKTQKLLNEVLTPLFGTTRYARPAGFLRLRFYHPERREYIQPFCLDGLRLAGRVVLALASHRQTRHK